jgi:hypothetical protein
MTRLKEGDTVRVITPIAVYSGTIKHPDNALKRETTSRQDGIVRKLGKVAQLIYRAEPLIKVLVGKTFYIATFTGWEFKKVNKIKIKDGKI